MRFSLRVRLIGTLALATLVCFAVGTFAAQWSMSNDLRALRSSEVAAGARGLVGYLDQRREQIRLLAQQLALNEGVRSAIQTRNHASINSVLDDAARQGGLSVITVVDTTGRVIGSPNPSAIGKTLRNAAIDRALTGDTVSTIAPLSHAELTNSGLDAQTDADVMEADGKPAYHMSDGIGFIAATPVSDANQRVIGVLYACLVLNHYYDIVDQASHALGGDAAIIMGQAIVSGTISRSDGSRLLDVITSAGHDAVAARKSWSGIDTEGGVPYAAHVDPILDDQGRVVAASWYGRPIAPYDAVRRHTLVSNVLWGLVGMILALLVAVPFVSRLTRSIMARSRQVSASAKELAVVVVGTEVSGDHVAQTRDAIEKQGDLIMSFATETADTASGSVATATGVSERVLALAALNAEIHGDVLVIDTLAHEMNARMEQAVAHVASLNDVASGLDRLVTGAR